MRWGIVVLACRRIFASGVDGSYGCGDGEVVLELGDQSDCQYDAVCTMKFELDERFHLPDSIWDASAHLV